MCAAALMLYLLQPLNAETGAGSDSVTAVGCGGGLCLLGVYHSGESRLVKYDGHRFEDLSEKAGFDGLITVIAWNGDYFLIGGDNGRLYKYDGTRFRDLSEMLGWGQNVQVQEIIPSGRVWVIYGASVANERVFSRVFDGEGFSDAPPGLAWELIPAGDGRFWFICHKNGGDRVCEYNGTAIAEVAEIPYAGLHYRPFWNGEYMLLVVDYTENGRKHSRLLAFDGNGFTELNYPPAPVAEIAWNGNYWLVNYRSDGKYKFGVVYRDRFAEVDAPLDTGASAIACNGDYCLVSYRCDGLYRFSGADFENLSTDLKKAGTGCVSRIIWSGNFWLLLLQEERGSVVLKYDGSAFRDITPFLTKTFTSKAAEKSPESPPEERKAVCGPAMLMLLTALILAGVRKAI